MIYFMVVNVMTLGNFEMLVLLAVMRLGKDDAYGVRIRRELIDVAEHNASLGAIIVVLDRLREKGFVDSKWGEPTKKRGGRRKRHYWLTVPGQQELNEALSRVDRLADGLRPVLGGA